jgi:glutathione S-transferase
MDYTTTLKSPEYLAINPMGKVPALRHGDAVVTECAAICAYLADAFPAAGLAPEATSPLRGPYYRWLFFAAGCIEPAITNKALGVVVPPERAAMPGYGSMERMMDALEAGLDGRQYLVGDHFTAADLYVGAQIGWGLQFGLLERRQAFETYFNALKDRPAAIRAREIDDKLIEANKPVTAA